KGVFSLGVDTWWMDSTEPDHLSQKPEDLDTKTYLGSFRKVRNAYPLMTVGGVHDHQRETTNDKRVFILTRSAFAGQQRYAANTWSGDVNSSWEMLRNQVPAGLNFSLTGNPNFNSDIGGFFAGVYKRNGGANNPMFQELYVRWLQYGTFTPMMRSHGTDVPREIYQFGQKGDVVYDIIEKFIRLRYSMLPYIYSTSWDVSKNNSSFLRALSMDFSSDRKTWNINNEYLFGKSFLVVPILNAQYTPEKIVKTDENEGWNKTDISKKENSLSNIDFTQNKKVKLYLPADSDWFDFWTNEKHKGGQEIQKTVNLQSIPLYVKAGSIIPFGPDVQYATEKKWDNLTVKIYPGTDADFVLYEDEFDNYNYEKGDYTEIPFHWNEKSKTLTIDSRKGNFKGMIDKRNFNIILPDGQQKSVNYSGKKINVSFK
ncbi:MAG: TIM-barrel domain-containing protein, partial [Chryseobacterium sp.]